MNRNTWITTPVRERRSVQGFTIWSASLNLLLFGALLVIALRVVPGYVEYLTVKDVITRAAQEHDPRSETVTDLKMRIAKLLNTNQIYDVSADNIKVYRERGVIVIDARYEKRFPFFWILDGVMKFDDLLVETAQAGRA
jgi:cell division protein FtsL